MRILKFFVRIYFSLQRHWFVSIFRSEFKHCGNNVRIFSPDRILGLENIAIGDNVLINNNGWIEVNKSLNSNPQIIIEDNCTIGRSCHIICTGMILLRKNVLIADNVYIADNQHGFDDFSISVLEQPLKQLKNIEIGEGTWIGENVCIIGSKVGRNCVIGANSVVTKDIPDYSVAVGSPARIIRSIKPIY